MDAVSWWVLFVIVAALAGTAAVVMARKLSGGRAPGMIHPADEAELDAIFARVADEDGHERLGRLADQLSALAARGVPLRWLRPAAGPGRARLGFADGTVVVASSRGSSSFGLLARHCSTGRVVIGRVTQLGNCVEVELKWADGTMIVDVCGVDQVD